jgi:excisionase family DNA binding protein
MKSSTLTPAEIATRLRVSPDKILQWIHNGEIAAINVAKNVTGRPRFRIHIADLAAFELRRRVQVKQVVRPRRRRQKGGGSVTEFF